MAIVVTCPRCDRRYSLGDAMAGRRVVCKECSQEFGVPGGAAPAKASSWDADDGRPIAFAAPAPARSAPIPRPSGEVDDDAPPPARVKAQKKAANRPSGGGNRLSVLQIAGAVVGAVVLVLGMAGVREYVFNSGDTPRARDGVALVREYASQINELAALFEQGTSQDAIQAMMPQATTLQQRSAALMSRMREFGNVTGAEDRYIRREAGPSVREALTRVKIAARGIGSNPALAGRLGLFESQIDQELKRWGGPTREIPAGPAPAISQAAPPPGSSASPTPASKPAEEVAIPADADAVTRSLLELKSSDPIKRRDALIRLAKTTPDARADAVVSAATAELDGPRRVIFVAPEAVKVLGAWPTEAGTSRLCALVSDEDILVRNEAIASLARSKDPAGIEPIIGRLMPDRYHASQALAAYGAAAEAPLIALLKADDPMVRAAACDVLAKVGGKEALDAMRKLPPDDHPYTRIQAKLAWDEIVKRVGAPPSTAKSKSKAKAKR